VTVGAERALLARLEGGCELAFGAWCEHESESSGSESVMVAMVERDGEVRRETARGLDASALAEELWRALSAAPAGAAADR
jgi:porphobilinogen deaminase